MASRYDMFDEWESLGWQVEWISAPLRCKHKRRRSSTAASVTTHTLESLHTRALTNVLTQIDSHRRTGTRDAGVVRGFVDTRTQERKRVLLAHVDLHIVVATLRMRCARCRYRCCRRRRRRVQRQHRRTRSFWLRNNTRTHRRTHTGSLMVRAHTIACARSWCRATQRANE